MNNGIHDKKARIPILISLIIVSLAEIIFRAVAVGEAALSTANAGEQVTVIAFATIILFFTEKGNDRISYVCCGVFIAYFVMDQLFEFPGMLGNMLANISNPIISVSIAIRLLTMIGIIAISAFLIEYINDGSIYNRAFIACYWLTVLLHVVLICVNIGCIIFADAPDGMELSFLRKQTALLIFNNLYRIIMVVLFTSFAYDSAKLQLKREKLS